MSLKSFTTSTFIAACVLLTPARAESFDYYVLAMSWSPTYCAEEAPHKPGGDAQQCAVARPYSFVVHGLWPNVKPSGFARFSVRPDSEKYKQLQFCDRTPEYIPNELIDKQLDIMPSKPLILHQWKKHGTCSGQSATAYFETVRAARAKLAIPAAFQDTQNSQNLTLREIKSAFLDANPKLAITQLNVTCSGQKLKEVRVCMNQDLNFTDCHAQRDQCPRESIYVPPAR